MSSLIDRTISGIPREVWDAFCRNAAKVKGDNPDKIRVEELDMAGHYFLAKLIHHVYEYSESSLMELGNLIYMVEDGHASIHLTDVPLESIRALDERVVAAGFKNSLHYFSSLIEAARYEKDRQAKSANPKPNEGSSAPAVGVGP